MLQVVSSTPGLSNFQFDNGCISCVLDEKAFQDERTYPGIGTVVGHTGSAVIDVDGERVYFCITDKEHVEDLKTARRVRGCNPDIVLSSIYEPVYGYLGFHYTYEG